MKKNKYVILDLLNIPITIKKIFFIFFDVFLCFLSSWLAFYLRLGSFFNINDKILITFLVSILIAIPVFFIVGLYNNITRVFNYLTILFLFKCSVFFGLVYFTIVTIWGLPGVPRTIGVIHPVVLFFTLVLSRFSVFYLFNL
jgi:FlaA1/EpsC-like NDP-sugar epimerase